MLKHTNLISKFHSWSSLEQGIAGLPDPKLRGNIFEEFCLAYLKLTPEYQLKNVWIQGQFPSRVVEELQLSGQKDQGIDLVAETNSGKLWAIQAKFRSDRKDIVSYKELSTFLAVSDRADYRLIISNTEQLPSIIGKRSRCGEALIDRLSVLDESYFVRLHKFLELGKPVEVTPLSPKPHQKDAIAASIKHYQTLDRGQLIMACGSGKTLTAVWIAEQLGSQKILVMIPSLALMRQTISVWAENFKSSALNYMCICSDASVAEEAKSDRPVGNLWELDIPVTTDSHEARKLILDNSTNPLIVFSTYQSGDVLSKAVSGLAEFRFDLAICDEAHRTAGMNKGLFNLVLDDKHIPCHKRLFMTATPRILDKHIVKRGQEEDVELFSMADETKYGKEVYRLSFGEAIRLKLLCDFKVAVAIVTDDEVRQVISLRSKVQIQSERILEREAEGLAKQIAFIKAVAQYGIKHTISFHSRVADAQSFSDKKSDHGLGSVIDLMTKHDNKTPQIATFHVNGAVPAGQRANTISEFAKSQISVISNARCLTEGVDIPSVDGVVFYDPKYRLTDIVQATGRALRLYEGKTCGYLIIPVFLKSDESANDLLESSDFSQVWSVIKAMQSQDERLDEIIKALRVLDGQIDGGRMEKSEEKKSLEEKLHEHILIQGVPNRISAEQFIKKIDIKLLYELATAWDYKYGLLKAFRKKNPQRWPSYLEEFPIGTKLGAWCHGQRMDYKRKRLAKNRIDHLNRIGFLWREVDNWLSQYKNLIEFRKKHPERWPASNEEYPKGTRLGVWCTNQRYMHKTKRLESERVDRLNAIGFIWVERERNSWSLTYEALIKFRRQNPGHWPSSRSADSGEKKLAVWCHTQRVQRKRNILDKQRINLLNKIGFVWEKADSWTLIYESLVEFRKKNPDRWPVGRGKDSDEQALIKWCNRQRKLSDIGKLNQTRIDLLSKLGFRWDKDYQWTYQYENLIEFTNSHSAHWPRHDEQYPKGNKLGWWCVIQRRSYRNNKLPTLRIDLLNKIGFPWELSEDWNTKCRILTQFRNENPNRWPTIYEKDEAGNKIGAWCAHLKAMLRNGSLPEDLVTLLNKLNFPLTGKKKSNVNLSDEWMAQYKHLVRFRREHPDRWPSFSDQYPMGNKLGAWCREVKVQANNDNLTPMHIRLLNNINFSFDLDNTWKRQYRNLIQFRKQHPDRWIKDNEDFPKGNDLGGWCRGQRNRKKNASILKDQIALLDEIGFPWELKDRWKSQYEWLVDFRKEYPDRWPLFSEQYPPGNKLGAWCRLMLASNKCNKLTQTQKDALNSIGFPLPDISKFGIDANWNLHYHNLIQFRKEHPDIWPSHGHELSDWCDKQRSNKKLTNRRFLLLKKIDFPFA